MNHANRFLVAAGSAMAAGRGLFASARAALRAPRALDLRDRTVVITGGSRGLGLLLAEEFGRLGARIAICGREPDALSCARERLQGQGIPTLAVSCDVGDRVAAEAFVDEVANTFGRIDIVVNNAGVIRVGPLDQQSIDDIEDVMHSNFHGAVNVTFSALSRLRLQGRDSRIVNITSVGGRVALPHMLSYSASKFALIGFSEGLRTELDGMRSAPRVVTVIPGLMRTGSFENAQYQGKPEEELGIFAPASSLPLLSIDARSAARRIVRAARDGRPFLRLGLSAHLADFGHRISPELTVRALGLVSRFMPAAGTTYAPTRGRDIASPIRESVFVRAANRAAATSNEDPRPH